METIAYCIVTCYTFQTNSTNSEAFTYVYIEFFD